MVKVKTQPANALLGLDGMKAVLKGDNEWVLGFLAGTCEMDKISLVDVHG